LNLALGGDPAGARGLFRPAAASTVAFLYISRSGAADPVLRITITRIAAALAAAAQFVSIKGCTASKWPLVTFIMRCLVRWCALVGILLHTVGALPAGLYAPGKLISCSCATRQ